MTDPVALGEFPDVEDAIVRAVLAAVDNDGEELSRLVNVVLDHEDVSLLCGAACAWGVAFAELSGMRAAIAENGGGHIAVEPQPGNAAARNASKSSVDHAHNLAAFIAACANNDLQGAARLWSAMHPNGAMQLIFDILSLVGDAGRAKERQS